MLDVPSNVKDKIVLVLMLDVPWRVKLLEYGQEEVRREYDAG
jgi:hypothetical protein